ncbi:MAG TPA: ribosome assembly factor SBDS [Candidatus Thermoplasmatota archaeon]|nr:ribosome assembly factor SBDS [Candidatus Thermoplasmatota archaeon]
MVSVDEAVIARLESHGMHMELLVDPEIALEFREKHGEMQLDLDDILASRFVFIDAKAGEKASNEELAKVFETTELEACVRRVLTKGELQLTTDQRRRMVERKRKLIVSIIARNAINPQTGTPHPPTRIENAMDEARVHIDPFRSADAQVQDVLKVLRPLIPIRFEHVSIAVHLPADHAPKAYAIVKGFGELKKEEWQRDGSWIGIVDMPAGLQTEFYGELNKRTHGNVETRIVKQPGTPGGRAKHE